jgi:23S rRNA (uracil747-C5)-methyltransferase
MIRFVLRTAHEIPRIRKALPRLVAALPRIAVVSVNLQPEHKAILEGETELLLTERSTLPMRVNDVVLGLRPNSFFQTNTAVAAALYRQAREWVEDRSPGSVWDLYCGVGGFALHCAGAAGAGRQVLGVEVSPDAVESARHSASRLGVHRCSRLTFVVGDARVVGASGHPAPDLVVVNPPRRGIGRELARWLDESSADQVVYSSCNVDSLERDLAAMPSFAARSARLFDMFPQTGHHEVLVLLERSRP